jgi:hypothetical protein
MEQERVEPREIDDDGGPSSREAGARLMPGLSGAHWAMTMATIVKNGVMYKNTVQ